LATYFLNSFLPSTTVELEWYRMKLKFIVIGMICGTALLVSFLTTLPDGKLHITFCDVGQGDATYIRFPDGRNMLVDGGPDNKVVSCLGENMPFWDRTIDMVVLTHPEKDHFGGLTEVVKRYKINYFLFGGSQNSEKEYQTLLKEITVHNIQTKEIHSGNTIQEGATSFSFVWPNPAYVYKGQTDVLGATSGYNDQSLVFILRYGTFSAFFAGDAGDSVEREYVQIPSRVAVLKVPHHGSATGMTDEFITQLAPKLAVISVGKKNRYHHPSEKALQLLSSVHAKIIRTDTNGTVTVVSNGKTWEVTQKKQ
jgi:competence protein ComEC